MIKDTSGANVDLNDYVNVAASSGANVDANVIPRSSMSINDLPSPSFVSSSSSKRKVLDKDKPLAMSWKKQIHKNADEAIRRFFFVEDIPDFKATSAYFHDMLNVVANVGPSYKPPSPFQLRKRDLNEEVKYVESEMLRIREKWKLMDARL